MNERIKQLAEQVGWDYSKIERRNQTENFDEQKFAELIVKECVGVVEGGSFLHDQAPTAIFARECSGAIKQHFGVEGGW